MDKNVQRIRDIQYCGEMGGVVPDINHAATTTFLDPDDMDKVFRGEIQDHYLYSRHSNPTVNMFSKKLAAMENMPAAIGVASGMAAIACAVEQILIDGGHIVSSNTIYGGTYALFNNILTKRGIKVTFVNPSDVKAFEEAITPDTKLIYTESVSNPLLAISDLSSLGNLARKNGIKLVVDNTFTPLIVTPAKYGADVVIHSCTKYLSGAGDLIGGAICSDKEFIDSLRDLNTGMAMLYGPVMDPRVAYILYSRLDHLHLRMKAHSNCTMYLVDKMKEEGVKGVIYPGLQEHPQHELMKEMVNVGYGFGGMITLDCGTMEKAKKLAQLLQEEQFGLFAVSLGFSRTLMSCPSASTSSEIPEDEQEKIGLKPGLIRFSIGFTGDDEVMANRFLTCYRQVCAE